MPTPRSEIAVAELDGKVYVAGGFRSGGGMSDALEAYDPDQNSWQELPADPRPFHHGAMAAAGQRLYVTGGYLTGRFLPNSKVTWMYDSPSKQWSQVADMPAERAAHAMVALDGKLYVVGGVGPDSDETWVYDPDVDRWDRRAPLPTGREHLAAAVVGGRVYVIGGRTGRGNHDTLEAYDPGSDSWTRLPAMPTARGGLTASVAGGRIHVAGGEGFSPLTVYPQHEVFDPGTGAWSALEDLPTARHGLGSAAVGDRFIVVGGGEAAASASGRGIVEVYAE